MAETQDQQNNSGSSSDIQINIKGAYRPYCRPSSETPSASTGPSELKLQITIGLDKTVLELKQAIAQKSDVEADRQRLIYSGAPPILHSLSTPPTLIPPSAGRVLKVRSLLIPLPFIYISHVHSPG